MPYKDVTYDNGFTERFYYDETPDEKDIIHIKVKNFHFIPSHCQLEFLRIFVFI
jgi:hypothetical protein